MKIRQNDWSEFGKDFIVKMRKNTEVLQAFQHYIIRKNAQEFFETLHLQHPKHQQHAKPRKPKNECKQKEIRKRSFYPLNYRGGIN